MMEDRELLARLLLGETRLGAGTVAEIIGRGHGFAPNLVRLLGTVRLWHTEDAGRVAVFHAVKLLGALKFEPAVPTLVDAIFLGYGTAHEDVLEELPVALGRIGPEAVGPLQSVLEDKGLHPTIRSVAASALEAVAVAHPLELNRVLELLRAPMVRLDEPAQLRTHLIGLVARFRLPQDRDLVRGALHVIPTAIDISNDEIEDYFESRNEPIEWSLYRGDPLEYYDDELA